MRKKSLSAAELDRVCGGNDDGFRAYPWWNPAGWLKTHNHNVRHLKGEGAKITGEVLGTETGAKHLHNIVEGVHNWTSPLSWGNYFINGK